MLDKIKKDLLKAMKSKDKVTRSTLRLIINAINNYKKAREKTDEDITDELVYKIVGTEIKQTKDLLDYALKGRRLQMLEELGERLNILDNYMPSQMTDEDIYSALLVIAEGFGIKKITNADRGVLIKKAIILLQGKTDGPRINRQITKIIKEIEEEEAQNA